MSRIAVIGYGSFGTALSIVLGKKGHDVSVMARDRKLLEDVKSKGKNEKYLPEVDIPENIKYLLDSDGEKEALTKSDYVLFAVPAQVFGDNLTKYKEYIAKDAILVNVAKGIEKGSLRRLSRVAKDVAPEFTYVALSGPSHAEEVGRMLPTTVTVSSENSEAALEVQKEFITDRFRIYTNDDLIGTELGGALKNVMALGAGISDGLGFGDNAKAALMTRGITEIGRLGIKMGARFDTFAGLSGIGDLIVTCTSMHSRNRRCGIMIGEGLSPDEATRRVGMVVEGISTCYAAKELAEREGVEMPITNSIKACLDGELTPEEAINQLMGRSPKKETEKN